MRVGIRFAFSCLVTGVPGLCLGAAAQTAPCVVLDGTKEVKPAVYPACERDCGDAGEVCERRKRFGCEGGKRSGDAALVGTAVDPQLARGTVQWITGVSLFDSVSDGD